MTGRTTSNSDEAGFGPTDPRLEDLVSVAFGDFVSARLALSLRLHQTVDEICKPDQMSEAEFNSALEALQSAERMFAKCLDALAWSKTLTDDCFYNEPPLSLPKKSKQKTPPRPSPDLMEAFADGNTRQLERMRRQLKLRQFQAIEDASCPEGVDREEFTHLKQMLRALQMFYAFRIEELAEHNARLTSSASASRKSAHQKIRR